MEGDALQFWRLGDRAFRAAQMLPENAMFAVAEEAARGLAESDIRWLGNARESVASDMSEMLVDALRSNAIIELYRASIRLYTMRTTLYLDANSSFREYEDRGQECFGEVEPDLWGPEADEVTRYTGWFAWIRRMAPEGKESLACYFILLEHALLRWPERVGEIEVYRGVELGEDDIERYRERVGKRVAWAGFASTSRSRRIAERFGNVVFVIHTRDRPYVGAVSVLRKEREVLFANRTCTFVIEGVTGDPRTGRVAIELRDFQCFDDYDKPLTLEETRELVGRELCFEFGGSEGLVLLDGPVGQERMAKRLQTGGYDGELLSRMIRLGSEAWRKDRARWEAAVRAAKTEGERRARVDVGLMLRAVGTRRPGLIARLVALGADPDATKGDGETPLMLAAYNGDWQTVRQLLDAGANARAVRPGTGKTALHFGVLGRSVKTVRVLLSAGVDVDAICGKGCTPLLHGVELGLAATVALLLNAGAAPSTTCTGLTPLHEACRQGRLEIVDLLLRAGADTTARDAGGATALHVAISGGHTAVVRLLLTVAAVEEPGPDGDTTPLFTAVVWKRAEIVQLLARSWR
jgi:ankyrin repeat protein